MDIILNNKIPFVRVDGQLLLIDTGSHVSISDVGDLSIAGREFETLRDINGITPEKLRQLTDTDTNGLLGMDVLSRFRFCLDYAGGSFEIDPRIDASPWKTIPIETIMGVPIFRIGIRDTLIKCILDTGAAISYLCRELTRHCEPVGMEHDFHPFVGEFETPLFRMPWSLEGMEFESDFGNLPALIDNALLMLGTPGLVGYDFLATRRVVVDVEAGQIELYGDGG